MWKRSTTGGRSEDRDMKHDVKAVDAQQTVAVVGEFLGKSTPDSEVGALWMNLNGSSGDVLSYERRGGTATIAWTERENNLPLFHRRLRLSIEPENSHTRPCTAENKPALPLQHG